MIIRSGQDLHDARKRLGLSMNELAARLRLQGDGAARIREMESGARQIGGPTAVAVESMLREAGIEGQRAAYQGRYRDGRESSLKSPGKKS